LEARLRPLIKRYRMADIRACLDAVE
jgi:hypothetical protein